VASAPLAVSLLSMAFAVVSILGGILLALGAAIPISPYVTTISFTIYLICRLIGRRGARRADVGFRP
jgi:zinc/manganese transport system permease protein